jgi:hypothetical protein
MPTKQNDIDLEPLLNVEQEQLSLIMDEGASIDNKALALLAVAVAVLIFIAQASLKISQWWHGVVIIGPHIIALVCIGFAVWPRSYLGASPDIEQYPENLKLPRNELVLQLLVNTSAAVKHNNRLNLIRWRWCAAAVVTLLVGAAVLFAIL